jgi:hypothetical protein
MQRFVVSCSHAAWTYIVKDIRYGTNYASCQVPTQTEPLPCCLQVANQLVPVKRLHNCNSHVAAALLVMEGAGTAPPVVFRRPASKVGTGARQIHGTSACPMSICRWWTPQSTTGHSAAHAGRLQHTNMQEGQGQRWINPVPHACVC